MTRHDSTSRNRWRQRYLSALISALGAATILHLDDACKTLHALSSDAIGLTSPEKSDKMRADTMPEMEVKAMTTIIKKYRFADGVGTVYDIDNGDAVIDFVTSNGDRIAQITVCYEHGTDKAWRDTDKCLQSCQSTTIRDALTEPTEWDNGMGGSAFDSSYFTDF